MKIFLIASDAYPFFIDTANNLSKRGYEIHLFCSRDLSQKQLHEDIIVHNELNNKLDAERKINIVTFPLNLLNFRKKIRKINPHIIHSFNIKWSGWMAALSSFHPLIVSTLGSDIIKKQKAERDPIIKYLKKITIKQSDVVTYVSNQINDEIKRVDENKTTHLFRHGTYDNFYKPGAPPKELIKLFKANKEVIFFSPRLLKPIYQNDKIIEAFSDFYKTSNKSRLLLAGDTKQNTKYVSRLKNIIKNEKLVNNVHFLGYLSKNEMLDYYRLSDIVVSYPISDGMPATVFEAMAIGKPLILSDTISSNEIFTTGYDTIICDKNNTNELADSMKLLWDNSELQKKITANAKETFSKYGDANKFISELEMIYKHLLQ